MKTMLLAATVLAAAVTTPALAQTRSQDQWRGPFTFERDYSGSAYGMTTPRRPMTRSYDVYDQRGQYLGTDPDPSVRDQLRRDPTQGD
jgi:hypothetical protein